jgi:hypothetical protein
MIIYNVTINIENDVREEWLAWMKERHIPDVMKTGCFTENKICKVLVEEEQGTTYSVQYTCESIDKMQEYQQFYAPRFQKEHTDRFPNKFVAFRTLLEIV